MKKRPRPPTTAMLEDKKLFLSLVQRCRVPRSTWGQSGHDSKERSIKAQSPNLKTRRLPGAGEQYIPISKTLIAKFRVAGALKTFTLKSFFAPPHFL